MRYVNYCRSCFLRMPRWGCSQDICQNRVKIQSDLLVLANDITRVNRHNFRRVKAYHSGEEYRLTHYIYLTVRADIWRGPEAETLHMQILLLFIKRVNFLWLMSYKEHDDFIARYLNTNSHRWFDPKILYVFSIKLFKLCEVTHKQPNFQYELCWNLQSFEMLHYSNELIFLRHSFDRLLWDSWI